jgi:hypothetical protein
MERNETVLRLLARGYEVEMAYVRNLPVEQRSQRGTWERWAIKDSVAHSAAWRRHLASGLAAVADGRAPERADDYEHQNRLIYEEHAGMAWPEVEAFATDAHRKLTAQASRLSAEQMDSTTYLPWQRDRPLWRVVLGTGFNHPLIHIADHLKQDGAVSHAADLVGEMAAAVVDLDDSADWQGTVKYNLACRHALLGATETAVERLSEAFELNADLLPWSKEDPDLESIRDDPACLALYARHGHD